jgi:hypothetical protein
MLKAQFQRREYQYPCLMEYNLCGVFYIVLMSDPGVGMVVMSNDPKYPVGLYEKDWLMEVHKHRYYKPYTDQVILSNL